MPKEVSDTDHAVYLLRSKNPKYLDRSYIGYTVDLQRRLKQHNAGVEKGGAKRTNEKGPWEMYLFVTGFMSDVTALRFEWAWQKYSKFKSLKEKIGRRKHRESRLNFNLRILEALLNHPPWHRAPLNIVVLDPNCNLDNILLNRPKHIDITRCRINYTGKRNSENKFCSICYKDFDSDNYIIVCYMCETYFHVCCCGDHFNQGTGHIIPTMGSCPNCLSSLIWGRLIRDAVVNEIKKP